MTVLNVLLAVASLGLTASASAATPAPAKTFPSPQAAADALVAAAAAEDVPALLAIFGAEGKGLVESGDEVRDHNDRVRFAADAREKLEIATDPKDAHQKTIVVGSDPWPFPVPLVEKNGKWSFATKKGLREVLTRRVGANELDAIEICRGYVDAQMEYAEEDRDGNGVLEYAQKIISSPGKRDGLAWRNTDGSLGGPIAENIAAAIAEGYSSKSLPYHGYHFRVLKAQGPSAKLGAMSYVIDGKMIGGFALIAWPAKYGSSGVKTFIVSHDGVVYEKDLGPDTTKLVSKIDRYDPDKSWHAIPDGREVARVGD